MASYPSLAGRRRGPLTGPAPGSGGTVMGYGTPNVAMSPGMTPYNNPAYGGYGLPYQTPPIKPGALPAPPMPQPAGGVGGGGFYPSPYNQTGQAQAAPPAPWKPVEYQRPATPYPGQQTPGQAKYYKRPSFGGRMGGYPLPPSYKPLDQFNRGETGLYASQMNVYNAGQAQLPPYMQRGGYNYGGSGGGAGGFQSAYDEARAENEARYRDILDGYEARREAMRGAGSQESRDIDRSYTARQAAQQQGLVSRGLNNSTLLDTMRMGVDRERTDAQGRLGERLRREEADLTGDELSYMERRTDLYPNEALLAQLAQGVGAAGGGGGAYTAGLGYTSPQSLGYQLPWGMNYAGPIGGGVRGGGVRTGGYGSAARKTMRELAGPDSANSAAAVADRLRRMAAARAVYSRGTAAPSIYGLADSINLESLLP